MTHLPVARWGIDWLERGTVDCRFSKPVYDGKFAVSATKTVSTLAITVESEAERCATGTATLPDEQNTAPQISPAATIPAFDEGPDADEATLAVGRHLSSQPLHLTAERLHQYLSEIGETEPLYARERVVHPALMLRLANSALTDNVKLGTWIHAGSAIRHCGLAHAGEIPAAHATVIANFDRKGHRFVDLDVVIVADNARVVAQIRQTAIYRLQQA